MKTAGDLRQVLLGHAGNEHRNKPVGRVAQPELAMAVAAEAPQLSALREDAGEVSAARNLCNLDVPECLHQDRRRDAVGVTEAKLTLMVVAEGEQLAVFEHDARVAVPARDHAGWPLLERCDEGGDVGGRPAPESELTVEILAAGEDQPFLRQEDRVVLTACGKADEMRRGKFDPVRQKLVGSGADA